MERLTKLQIIEETVAYYSANPVERRAVTQCNRCYYITCEGQKCAIGRCMISTDGLENYMAGIENLLCKKFGDDKIGVQSYLNEDIYQLPSGTIINEPLMEQYRGHEIEFWIGLQSFHDSSIYWNEAGLSLAGVKQLQLLKNRYTN